MLHAFPPLIVILRPRRNEIVRWYCTGLSLNTQEWLFRSIPLHSRSQLRSFSLAGSNGGFPPPVPPPNQPSSRSSQCLVQIDADTAFVPNDSTSIPADRVSELRGVTLAVDRRGWIYGIPCRFSGSLRFQALVNIFILPDWGRTDPHCPHRLR